MAMKSLVSNASDEHVVTDVDCDLIARLEKSDNLRNLDYAVSIKKPLAD